ncbi:MAG: dihydrolipoamide acyltransferase [Bacteroidales bacterium]|nr:dihydrolipoamide acyltransferase [Bacteroidales bacterium]
MERFHEKTWRGSFDVEGAMSARSMGSGEVSGLSTPSLVAMVEQACWKLVVPGLGDGETTVGTEIKLTHERPSAVGNKIEVEATLVSAEGRMLRFEVVAKDNGNEIAHAEHARVIVNKDKFESKISQTSH